MSDLYDVPLNANEELKRTSGNLLSQFNVDSVHVIRLNLLPVLQSDEEYPFETVQCDISRSCDVLLFTIGIALFFYFS